MTITGAGVKGEPAQFAFDHCYGPEATQEQVYDDLGSQILDYAFEGYNGTSWTSVGGANVSNDTTTATALYPLFANVTSGAATSVFTSNAKLLYTPSNGELQSAELYANNGVLTHANQVTTSYTVPTNANVITVGPWTVASGATFTLPSGSRQVLL
jgi:hypothetical protein